MSRLSPVVSLLSGALAIVALSACQPTSPTTPTPAATSASPSLSEPTATPSPEGSATLSPAGPSTPSGAVPGAVTPPPSSSDLTVDPAIMDLIVVSPRTSKAVVLPEKLGTMTKVGSEAPGEAAYTDTKSGKTVVVQVHDGSVPLATATKGLSMPATYGGGRVLLGQRQGSYRCYMRLADKGYVVVSVVGGGLGKQDAVNTAVAVLAAL